jgi:hypothetical protein
VYKGWRTTHEKKEDEKQQTFQLDDTAKSAVLVQAFPTQA